jgi:hypothetical protein
VLVEHSLGMQYLAVLLANPGQEIQAVELAAGPRLDGAAAVNTTAQPMLDEAARSAYRQRLAGLEAEIDEYDWRGDVESAERVRAEREWLVAELASAAGLGGWVRSFPTGHERARIAVGKAIRRALKRIATADPAIGEELRTTVQTGLRCCYRP